MKAALCRTGSGEKELFGTAVQDALGNIIKVTGFDGAHIQQQTVLGDAGDDRQRVVLAQAGFQQIQRDAGRFDRDHRAANHLGWHRAAADLSELFLESGASVDFLYLHDYRRPEFVEEVFRICADRTAQTSVFVIEGIRYTSRMRTVWKRISRHEKAGITFDLYDLGIIFFDKTRIKQDYIVNF